MTARSIIGLGLMYGLVAASALFSIGIAVNLSQVERYDSQEILVRFYDGYSTGYASDLISQTDLKILRHFSQIDVWLVVGEEVLGEKNALARLRQQPSVAWAEENGTVRIQEVIPNDNFYQAQQENLRVIGLPDAWMITNGADNLIGVIDTGIDLDHPDLQNKVWTNDQEIPANGIDDDLNGYIDDVTGWDFVNDDNYPQDDRSHGSHVSGIIAAQTNNVIGVAGVSWGARLMALKALNNLGDGTWADVAEAVLYASDNGAKVLNMSLGDEEASQTIELALEFALSKGCLVVAAAGNGGSSVLYPAAYPDVLAVSATDNRDIPWSFTNRGQEVDVAAPGVDIFSTSATGSYTTLSGTSMSTAHVSGVASLIWSLKPEYTSIEVSQIITSTASDVWSPGHDILTGWGRLSASQAVSQAQAMFTYLPIIQSGGMASPVDRTFSQ